ncbi:mitochondrial ribosomal protein L13 [Dermatophagoides farinae]
MLSTCFYEDDLNFVEIKNSEKNMSNLSPYQRVQQWMVFARQWWLFDAKQQDVFDAAQMIARYLHGRHKPIYDTEQDVGDHVVVMNAKHCSMPFDEWRYRYYFHHSHYSGGKKWTQAYELHQKDPNLIMYKAIYKACGNIGLKRHDLIAHLHIYPDENVPEHIMKNITDHIRQLRPVHKSIDEYSDDEIRNYPKIFDYSDDYTKK